MKGVDPGVLPMLQWMAGWTPRNMEAMLTGTQKLQNITSNSKLAKEKKTCQ